MSPSQRRVQILLERLPLTPHERNLALRSDPDVVALVVELLVAAAYWFNATAVEDFGGRLGPARDRGLVEQVVAAAFQTYGSVDPHPSPFAKAAMLFRGITLGARAIPSRMGTSEPDFSSSRISLICWAGRFRQTSTAVEPRISPSSWYASGEANGNRSEAPRSIPVYQDDQRMMGQEIYGNR